MNNLHIWLTVAVIALVTAALRFLPFVIWGDKRKTPKLITKLGGTLPYAIMGMLVIYCLKETSFASLDGFLPALISCIVVAVSYILKRNTLISIILGTLCNIILVQFVF
ncbi:MAG: AzlD domain-containing protein [Clostridia bacterium]|nr:AzlD domain-containing protein [Clostridia bacterium]